LSAASSCSAVNETPTIAISSSTALAGLAVAWFGEQRGLRADRLHVAVAKLFPDHRNVRIVFADDLLDLVLLLLGKREALQAMRYRRLLSCGLRSRLDGRRGAFLRKARHEDQTDERHSHRAMWEHAVIHI
jgi:hypothetical protein